MAITTLRQLILCTTALDDSSQYTVREHLNSMICESFGDVNFIPADMITANIDKDDFDANISRTSFDANIETDIISVDIDKKTFTVDIETADKDINHEC